MDPWVKTVRSGLPMSSVETGCTFAVVQSWPAPTPKSPSISKSQVWDGDTGAVTDEAVEVVDEEPVEVPVVVAPEDVVVLDVPLPEGAGADEALAVGVAVGLGDGAGVAAGSLVVAADVGSVVAAAVVSVGVVGSAAEAVEPSIGRVSSESASASTRRRRTHRVGAQCRRREARM